MTKVLVLHGPNLNMLGSREPQYYGATSLDDINAALQAAASQQGVDIEMLQSNAENELVEAIQQARDKADAIIRITSASMEKQTKPVRVVPGPSNGSWSINAPRIIAVNVSATDGYRDPS